jgi:hypothetical protein
MRALSGPEILMTPIPARPRAVAIAAMVSRTLPPALDGLPTDEELCSHQPVSGTLPGLLLQSFGIPAIHGGQMC